MKNSQTMLMENINILTVNTDQNSKREDLKINPLPENATDSHHSCHGAGHHIPLYSEEGLHLHISEKQEKSLSDKWFHQGLKLL
jgi:hypothetical protein